ncbi:MAG: hypothetical protein ACKESB_01715 [Candidatus Hodgkinia cicadicola]
MTCKLYVIDLRNQVFGRAWSVVAEVLAVAVVAGKTDCGECGAGYVE